jgi:hypothetical protein
MKYLLLLPCFYLYLGCTNSKKIAEDDKLLNYSYMLSTYNDSSGNYISNATGFIVSYNQKYFLVTNYHVLTGKNSLTFEFVPTVKELASSVFVIFRPTDTGMLYYPMKYPLYQPDKSKNFGTYSYSDKVHLLDLAVMQIEPPVGAKKYFMETKDIDTSTSVSEGTELICLGFPNGKFIDTWKPTKIELRSVVNKDAIDEENPLLYFNNTTASGMSGSPVYLKNNNKVVSINFMGDTLATDLKGYSVYFKYAFDIIRMIDSKNRPPVIGKFYKGK